MTDDVEDPTITEQFVLQDIPDLEGFDDLRRILAAVATAAADSQGVASALSMNYRQVRYWLDLARALGWVAFEAVQLSLLGDSSKAADAAQSVDGRASLTPLGKALLNAKRGSQDERVILAKSLLQSDFLLRVVGDFLASDISSDGLARRIQDHAKLSPSASRQRARTFIRWREYVNEGAEEQIPPQGAPSRTLVGAPQQAKSEPLLTTAQLGYLRTQVERARLLLLLGQGFSRACASLAGPPPPNRNELTTLLWELMFPNEPQETSVSLIDLGAMAITKAPKALWSLLKKYYAIASTPKSSEYRLWLDLPVPRAYTLAIDDLEDFVDKAHRLRRTPVPISSADTARSDHANRFPFLHLRGRASNGSATLASLRGKDDLLEQRRLTTQFEADFLAYPFLIVGDADDEDVLWDYIQLRGDKGPRGTRELRPKSFLICPELSRARRALLGNYNVEWMRATPIEFAPEFSHFASEIEVGHRLLLSTHVGGSDLAGAVGNVSALVAAETPRRTDYLLGKQPSWDDVTSGRAVFRDSDSEIEAEAVGLLNTDKKKRKTAAVLVLVGTVGSGKSTALMRLAMKLSGSGHRVGWVPPEFELTPDAIAKFSKSEHGFSVLAVDDIDKYARHTAARHIAALSDGSSVRLVITAMHSARLDAVQEHLAKKKLRSVSIPKLTNQDVGRLLDALESDRKLGVLTGKTRQFQEKVFREKAGRLLLVAMIEATSGRRFEEKVFEEWKGLPARAASFYTMIAVASNLGYALSRQELMLATESTRQSDDVAMLDILVQGGIVDKDVTDRYKCRHRLIAETLIKELQEHTNALAGAHVDLAYAVTNVLAPGMMRNTASARFVRKFISNRYLFGMLDLDEARKVYLEIEPHLHWDYHFWLQRGSLEVAEGDVKFAEQYLNTAKKPQ